MAHILCIEDEADIREMLAETLEYEGYDVYLAENGKVGLETILKHNPDLILCDINMPVMDGRELLKELRSNHPKFVETPFIFLSAFADRKDVMAGLELGADDYLTKPIDLEMLMTKVKSALRQVSLMGKKKQREHVKLYTALTSESDEEVEPKPSEESGPSMSIALVGKDDHDHSGVQKTLESFGHSIEKFSSGKNFVDYVGKQVFDLVLIGFYTSDIQGNTVAKYANQHYENKIPCILLWPEEMVSMSKNMEEDSFVDAITLPCTDTDLYALVAKWTAG